MRRMRVEAIHKIIIEVSRNSNSGLAGLRSQATTSGSSDIPFARQMPNRQPKRQYTQPIP